MKKLFDYKIVSFVTIILCLIMNIVYGMQNSKSVVEILLLAILNIVNFLYFIELPKNIYRSTALLVIYPIIQVIYNMVFVEKSFGELLPSTILSITVPIIMLLAITKSDENIRNIHFKQRFKSDITMVIIKTRHKIFMLLLMLVMIVQVATMYSFDYMTNTYFMRIMYAAIMMLPTLLSLSTYTLTDLTVYMYLITFITETIVVVFGIETSVITSSQIIMLATEFIIIIYLFIERGKHVRIKKDTRKDIQSTEG